MARRSDHSREELREMILASGVRLIKERGLGHFSARAIARDIGYSIGTIYNVFATHEELIYAINTCTLRDIRREIKDCILCRNGKKGSLLEVALTYLHFAQENHNAWSAVFEFNPPEGTPIPQEYTWEIEAIFAIVGGILPYKTQNAAKTLWASVHGICELGLSGKLRNTHQEETQDILTTFMQTYLSGLKVTSQTTGNSAHA